MNLIKTSFYTSISTGVTFLSGFVITKVVAVQIGPEGLAYVGQFQNLTGIFTMLAIAAINAGVIKYLAEYKNKPEKQQQVITTAITIILSCSFLVSIVVVVFSNYLSKSIFFSDDFSIVFILYGLFLSIISLNKLFISVLNGLKEIKKLTIVNISSSVVTLAILVLFATTWKLKGVLIAANFSAVLILCVNLYFAKKLKGINFKPNFKAWDKKLGTMLLAFGLMNVVSGFAGPLMQLAIRDYIIKNISIDDAGYWQAVTKISEYYLAFITSVLAVYYLPRLSEITIKGEIKREISKGYKIILPSVAFMAIIIWLSKEIIVHILFTPDFLPMLPLFKYQLLGDFLKIGSWLLAFLMLSKAMIKTYIVTEILFAISNVLISYWLISKYGTIGATYSHAINYAMYWLALAFLMSKHIKNSYH